MAKALTWSLCIYLVLKLIQYLFVAPPGFAKTDLAFQSKLFRGEPTLLLIAGALATSAALWSDWYFPGVYRHQLEQSADCYGKLAALSYLPEVEDRLDALAISKTVRLFERVSLDLAGRLSMQPDEAEELLSNKLNFYARHYADLSRQGDNPAMRAEATAVAQCLPGQRTKF